jgi:gliding motility-associated-like protein
MMRLFYSGLLFSTSFSLFAQDFLCEGKIYISQNSGTPPTSIYSIEYEGGVADFDFICEYSRATFNGLGFNSLDGHVYAFNRDDWGIYRLFSNGSTELMGYDRSLDRTGVAAGDINNRGQLILHDKNQNYLHIYELNPTFRKVEQIALYWNPSSPNQGAADFSMGDIVLHPDDPNTLITFQHFLHPPSTTNGYIHFIDMDPSSSTRGMVTPQFRIDQSHVTILGAFFIGPDNSVLAYGGQAGGGIQNRLIQIDLVNETSNLIATGPGATGLDGCSCPKSVEFYKIIDSVQVACDSTEVFYRLKVVNRSSQVKSGLEIADSIQRGGWLHVRKFLSENPGVFWSVSGQNMLIRVPDIQGRDSLDIVFSVSVSNDALPYPNQAYLRGVWAESDVAIPSDDPETTAFPDATILSEEDLDFSGLNHYVNQSFGLCDGDTIRIEGTPIYQPGQYNIPIGGIDRCDTILIANVEALKSFATIVDFSICSGDTLDFYGREITASGTYQEVFQASNSCDSIIEWNVRFEDTIRTTEDLVLCSGDTLFIQGLTITDKGEYSTWLPGSNCDTLLEVNVSFPPAVDLNVQATPSCVGQSNGSVELSFDQNRIQTWQWKDGSRALNRMGLDSGTYTLSYEDEFGCWSDTSIALGLINRPTLDFNVEPLDCHNDFIGNIEVDLADADSISLNDGPFVANSSFEIFQEGEQRLLIKKGHCVFHDSLMVPIIPPLEFEVKSISTGLCEDEVVIQVNLADGDPFQMDTIIISPLPTDASIEGDRIVFPLTQSISSIITVIDSHGCEYTRPIEVGLEEEGALFIPNVFTPNGDDLNDIFTAFTSPCIKLIEVLEVYDRWGELVYRKRNLQPSKEGWDGQLNGQVMDTGVYTWRLVLVGNDNERFEKSGSVTLLK